MKRVKRALVMMLEALMILLPAFAAAEGAWPCIICGASNTGPFCEECGNAKGSWMCDGCQTINTKNFCKNCGRSRNSMQGNSVTADASAVSQEKAAEEQHIDYENMKDAMVATIDGVVYEFQLDKAVVRGNLISIAYDAYNPRGELVYSVLIFLNKNISPGRYESTSSADVSISCSLMRAVGRDVTRKSLMEPQGSFIFELKYRSDDWMTYSGSFTANLVKSPTMFNSSDSMEIKDAEFNFTISAI